MRKIILFALCFFMIGSFIFAAGSQQELILAKWKVERVVISKNGITAKEKKFEDGKLETAVEFLKEGKGITTALKKGKFSKKNFIWEFLEEGIIQITPLHKNDQKGKALKLYIEELDKNHLVLMAKRKIEKLEFKIQLYMIKIQTKN